MQSLMKNFFFQIKKWKNENFIPIYAFTLAEGKLVYSLEILGTGTFSGLSLDDDGNDIEIQIILNRIKWNNIIKIKLITYIVE